MIVDLEYKAWKGYGRSEKPSTTGQARISVPGADSNRAKLVAMNTLDKYAREHDRAYAQSTSQVLVVV